LPEDLKRSFRDDLEEYERENQMPYVTSIERMGIEKGIEQGIEQGEDRATQKIALNMLRKNISLETIAEVTGLTISQLEGFVNDRLQQLQASPEPDLAN
jgi:predicted transposase/invertase (TIGR01784 family)